MQRRFSSDKRSGILLCLLVLGVITALAVLPNFNRSKAGGGTGLIQRTTSLDPDIPKMWDIREDKMGLDELEMYRQRYGRDASFVADIRDRFVRGEEALKQQFPTAKVEYNLDIRTPEVITPDMYAAKIQRLSRPSNEKRSTILREFIRSHQDLIGVNNEQIDGLDVVADYTNPNGNMAFATLQQRIGGVEVFRGEVAAGFTKNGEIIRIINNLAPGLDYNNVSRDFGDAGTAVRIAADHIKHKLVAGETVPNAAESTDLKVVFGSGDWATTAEKMYFPTEPGIAVPAWRVLIWQPVNAYYVMVDANTGVILWHKNITDDQTQSATYNVYANPTAYINVADHVAPLSPYGGPTSNPGDNLQGTLGTRTNITLIGNEGANSFNQLGWINDNTNSTDGNSNEAGVDRVAPNGVDAPMAGDTACPGAGCRIFSSTWNPPPGSPAPGDDPLTAQAQRGAVIQMFYIMNLHHDTLYLAGFTEAARNFQNTNFTGMGVGNDRVSSEGQDSSGTNNANFATPADGGRGRMQMFLWTSPTPDRDGTADAHIVIHEVSHGVSNRLIGNGSGLGNQGGMMGEGWGDWYAHTMTAEPTDDPLGVHGLGGYSLLGLSAGFANNYYGIRRFPTAVKASTGGPNNRPHNPLTFGHLNAGCDTTLGTTTTAVSSAYPRSPAIATSGNCSQVHNAGEIWKNALWEVRGLFVARKGFTNGTRDVLDAVTNGMKLTPVNPNFLQARDGVIAAATALPAAPQAGADALDVREGFRRHGMGFSASVQSATAVTEAFDAPTVGAGTASVTSGNNLLEPNECNTLNFTINNNSGDAATNISAVLSTTTPGVTVTQNTSAYPNMTAGQQGAVNTTPFQVSLDNTVACYTSASFSISISYTGGGGGSPVVANFSLPVGIPGNAYTFTPGMGASIPAGGVLVAGSQADDAAVAITLPAGWASTVYEVPVTSMSASTNGLIGINNTTITAFTNTALPAAAGATNPTLAVNWDDQIATTVATTGGGIYTNTTGTAPNRKFYVEWRMVHFAEPDGVPVNLNYAAEFTEGSGTIKYHYVQTGIAPNANGVSATIGVQRAQTGMQFTQFSFNTASTSPGFTLTGTLPAGQCTPGTGPCGPAVPDNPRADFDGDGKTDLSVFRPSEGNWYLQRSTDGFAVYNFGLATDTLVPGDFDGDGKADTAVFRPNADAAVNDFYVLNSNGFTVTGTSWGLPGDMAMTGDYDGDGKADRAVWRPSTGVWYVLNSGNGSNTVEPFGLPTDIPLAMDLEGDGKTNLATYRASENTWYCAKATGTPATNFVAMPFGATGDKLVQADYDGDSKDDFAVFRPSTGQWIIQLSTNNTTAYINFGISTDIPVPGDYDGDGKDDGAVYRNGTWHILGSTAGYSVQNFGVASDVPIPNKYLPASGGGGGGGAVTVSFNGATAIPDNNPAGVNISLPVAGVGTVSDFNFRLDTLMGGTCDGTVGDTDCAINHTWVGDIIIKITPPDGSPTVSVIDRIGVPVPSTVGCNNNNFGDILLNDEGMFPAIEVQGNPTGTTCNTNNFFPTGSFSPNNPLSAFDGENADGNWTINISDNAAADTGTVRRFSFIFNSGN